jgi:hypothetical protein
LPNSKEPFQAKLGWLIGSMYSRVGTTEWNAEKPDEKIGAAASKILRQTVIAYDDVQLKEALADLRAKPLGPKMSYDEINKFISKKKIVPRLTRFKEQATATLAGLKVVEPIRDKISSALWRDKALREAIMALSGTEIELTPEAKAGVILRMVLDKMGELATEEALPGRNKYVVDLVGDLMADNALKSFIR